MCSIPLKRRRTMFFCRTCPSHPTLWPDTWHEILQLSTSHLPTHSSLCMCLCVSLCLSLISLLCVSLCLCASVCVHLSLSVCVHLCLCTCLSVCISACVRLSLPVCVSASVCVSLCLCLTVPCLSHIYYIPHDNNCVTITTSLWSH